jgi:hypothetical protein
MGERSKLAIGSVDEGNSPLFGLNTIFGREFSNKGVLAIVDE